LNENTLTTARAELKREITEGQTLMELLYGQMERWIQRITRTRKPASPYTSTIVIFLLILAIGYLISVAFGEAQDTLSSGLLISSYLAISCASLLVALFNMRKLLESFRDQIVDFIESVDDIKDFQCCVTGQFFHRVKNYLFSMVLLILSFLSIFLIKAYSSIFVGAGFCTTLIIGNSLFGISFYFIIMMLFIPGRLSRYQYKLYAVNPIRSKVIANLTGILNRYTYTVVIFVAVITAWVNILFSSERFFIWFVLITIILNWIPILIQFKANQSSINNIVQKGKLKTLTEIQQKIEFLHANLKSGDRKTINTINRLMDYHDRIDKIRTSTLNLNSVVNLANQLLIPIVAIILANLEKLIGLIP
jgi:hypothetical protein